MNSWMERIFESMKSLRPLRSRVKLSQLLDEINAKADELEAAVAGLADVDGIVAELRKFDDHDLHEQAKSDPDLMRRLVEEYFYCG